MMNKKDTLTQTKQLIYSGAWTSLLTGASMAWSPADAASNAALKEALAAATSGVSSRGAAAATARTQARTSLFMMKILSTRDYSQLTALMSVPHLIYIPCWV